MEAWMLKIEPWRVNEPVVTDSHHCKAKLYPDLHPSEKLDPLTWVGDE